MTAITVTINDEGGDTSILVMNTCEDLRDDFRFFLEQAKAHDADTPETMFLHQRFLRAALFAVFAYAEAVVNGWLRAMLEERQMGLLFKRLEYDSLDRKVALLHQAVATTAANPKVEDAKRVRNLFIHFKPGRDAEAFEKLSVGLVEGAVCELERWMTAMEAALCLQRHDDSDHITRAFEQLGPVVKEVSSSQNLSACHTESQSDRVIAPET